MRNLQLVSSFIIIIKKPSQAINKMQFCFDRVNQHHVRLEVLVGEVKVIISKIL